MLATSWAIMTVMHKVHVVLTARKLNESLSLNSMGEPYPKTRNRRLGGDSPARKTGHPAATCSSCRAWHDNAGVAAQCAYQVRPAAATIEQDNRADAAVAFEAYRPDDNIRICKDPTYSRSRSSQLGNAVDIYDVAARGKQSATPLYGNSE